MSPFRSQAAPGDLAVLVAKSFFPLKPSPLLVVQSLGDNGLESVSMPGSFAVMTSRSLMYLEEVALLSQLAHAAQGKA